MLLGGARTVGVGRNSILIDEVEAGISWEAVVLCNKDMVGMIGGLSWDIIVVGDSSEVAAVVVVVGGTSVGSDGVNVVEDGDGVGEEVGGSERW